MFKFLISCVAVTTFSLPMLSGASACDAESFQRVMREYNEIGTGQLKKDQSEFIPTNTVNRDASMINVSLPLNPALSLDSPHYDISDRGTMITPMDRIIVIKKFSDKLVEV